MEETLSLILHGCKLARILETNLPHLSSQPIDLLNSCDELMRVFRSATDQLGMSSFPQMAVHDLSEMPRAASELDAAVQEWLKSSQAQTMDLQQAQFSVEKNMVTPEPRTFELSGMDMDRKEDVGGSSRSMSSTEFPILEGSRSGKTPMVQRTRKRKDGGDKRTVRVPAPLVGNTEIPPEDGFTWRKYGQKEILGSNFPRGYYRCTHKNFYGCQAKKQVQRLDDNPNIFELTYYGRHTCHISQTAPSALPQSAEIRQISHETSPNQPPSRIPISLSTWLTMDVEATISRAARGHSLLTRDVKEAECPVMDLADVMFNSGSSNNSMDSIFPSSMQDK